MAISVNYPTTNLAVGAYKDIVFSGKTGAEYFFDVLEGADKCTIAKQNSTTWRVTRTAAGTIRVRGSESPFGASYGRAINHDDGKTQLLEDGRLKITNLSGVQYYNGTAKLNAINQYVTISFCPSLFGMYGDTYAFAFISTWGGTGALALNDVTAVWKFERVAADKVRYYKNGVQVGSDITTSGSDLGYYLTVAPANSGLNTIFPRVEFFANGGAIIDYSEAISVISDPPPPPTADFTAPLTIESGATLSITNGTTGGSGTKVYVWEIDDVVTSPSGGTSANPVFGGLPDGLRKVKMTVTDDAGSDSKTVWVLVRKIFPNSTNIPAGVATEFTSSILNPTWTLPSGATGAAGSNGYKRVVTFGTTGSKTVRAANPSNSSQYEEATNTIYTALQADFNTTTSDNLGNAYFCMDATTGGYGTKNRVWKIDNITTAPTNGDYVNPTFAGLSAGAHKIKLTVTDDSGSSAVEKDIWVGTLSGAAFARSGVAESYSTNVPTPRTWSASPNVGSFVGDAFVAPEGSGTTTIKATNGAKFATKSVTYGPALTADFSVEENYGDNLDFTLTANVSGGGGSYSYQWLLNGVQVGTSSSLTLNKPIGNYELQLIVTDGFGNTDSATHTIHVIKQPLTCTYTPNTSLVAPVTISFTNTTSPSPTEPFWDFGDFITSDQLNPKHTFLVPGKYTIFRKGFVDGDYSDQKLTINIGGSPPSPAENSIEFDEVELDRFYLEGAKGGPTFVTSIIGNPIGNQQRNISRGEFLNVFELAFDKEPEEMVRLLHFFITRFGGGIGFRCFSPLDNKFENEFVANVTHGVGTYNLIRTYEMAGRKVVKRIVKPCPDLKFKLNGALVASSAIVVDYQEGRVTFNNPNSLTTGHVLTVEGEFCLPCVFGMDEFPATGFSTYFDLQGLKVVELLPIALGIED